MTQNNSQIFLTALISFSFSLFSQNSSFDFTEPAASGIRCLAEVVEGDTIPLVNLNTVEVCANYVFRTPRHYEQWTRTKSNVRKVYPYAIIAAAKLKEYDKALELINNKELRKAFIKVCERDLRSQFENELKELSISQGKVLMKLIDQECEKTTYEIVKQMRGGFQAMMWQTVARIFGHNMKVEYDAKLEDLMIERAVKVIEAGWF